MNQKANKKMSKLINIGYKDRGLSVICNAGKVQLINKPAKIKKAILRPIT